MGFNVTLDQNPVHANSMLGRYPRGNAPFTGIPEITNITGIFGQDNVLTISGVGFSANRSGQMIYENFDAGIEGNPITDIAGFTHTSGTTLAHEYKYATDEKYSGAQSAKLDFGVGEAAGFRPQFDLGGVQGRLFVALKMKLNRKIEIHSQSQVKLARLIALAGGHTSAPNMGATYQQSGSVAFNHGGTIDQGFFGLPPAADTWQSVFYYVDVGTIDQKDGTRSIRSSGDATWTYSGFVGEDMNSVSNDGIGGLGSDITRWGDTGNMNIIATGVDAPGFAKLLLPFYKRNEDTYDIWIDQVSVNDSLEAVFVSPEPTWTLAKTNWDSMVTQQMTSRVATNIGIKCEEGDLGATKYLYAVNASGIANEAGVLLP